MPNRVLARLMLSAAIATLAAPSLAQEINALVWCDHTDPALLEPFEAATGIKVNVKAYEGTAAGLAILDQSQPGDWDVMVIDAVDVGRAVDLDLLAPLPADHLATADFFPELIMAENNTRDGVTYAVTEKFGYNTIAFDKSKVDPADMEDMAALTSGKYDGRIAIYDYYLPVLGLLGLSQGVATASLDAAAVEALRAPLYALKAASKQVSDVAASQTALATGEMGWLPPSPDGIAMCQYGGLRATKRRGRRNEGYNDRCGSGKTCFPASRGLVDRRGTVSQEAVAPAVHEVHGRATRCRGGDGGLWQCQLLGTGDDQDGP